MVPKWASGAARSALRSASIAMRVLTVDPRLPPIKLVPHSLRPDQPSLVYVDQFRKPTGHVATGFCRRARFPVYFFFFLFAKSFIIAASKMPNTTLLKISNTLTYNCIP